MIDPDQLRLDLECAVVRDDRIVNLDLRDSASISTCDIGLMEALGPVLHFTPIMEGPLTRRRPVTTVP
jgi:hypothetical protein